MVALRQGPSPVSSKLYEASLWTHGTRRLTQWRNGTARYYRQGWLGSKAPMQVLSKKRHRMARRAPGGPDDKLRAESCVVFDDSGGCHVVYFQQQHVFPCRGEIEGSAGDGIRGTPKNKTPGISQSTDLRLHAWGGSERERQMCRTAHPGRYPDCQYAERLSGMAAASCICDRRCVAHTAAGQGGQSHGKSG